MPVARWWAGGWGREATGGREVRDVDARHQRGSLVRARAAVVVTPPATPVVAPMRRRVQHSIVRVRVRVRLSRKADVGQPPGTRRHRELRQLPN